MPLQEPGGGGALQFGRLSQARSATWRLQAPRHPGPTGVPRSSYLEGLPKITGSSENPGILHPGPSPRCAPTSVPRQVCAGSRGSAEMGLNLEEWVTMGEGLNHCDRVGRGQMSCWERDPQIIPGTGKVEDAVE